MARKQDEMLDDDDDDDDDDDERLRVHKGLGSKGQDFTIAN